MLYRKKKNKGDKDMYPKMKQQAVNARVVVLFLVFCTFQMYKSKALILKKNESYSALYTFGDSILDTGNNNNLIKSIVKSDFPPYGINFIDHTPTGRFSDGKVPSDLIVEGLGIKQFLPSYFDLNLQSQDLQTGLNFASGGSGLDPLTQKIQKVHPPSQQLQFYKEYIEKLRGVVGEERSKHIISNGLNLISYGNNDLLFSYFLTHLRQSQYDVHSYTDLLVSLASTFFKDLYELGARKFAVLTVIPLGCLPLSKTLEGGIERQCSEKMNEAVQLFNSKLSSQVASLQQQLPQTNFIFIDFYNPLLDIIQQPTKYGFEVANKGCCGTGLVETVVLCNNLEPTTCSNTSAYVFFDSLHPSERAYQIVVSQILQKYF